MLLNIEQFVNKDNTACHETTCKATIREYVFKSTKMKHYMKLVKLIVAQCSDVMSPLMSPIIFPLGTCAFKPQNILSFPTVTGSSY